MISFLIYFFILLILLYLNGFFHLFNDDKVTYKQLSLLFIGKALAVPVFYITYTKLYGGIEKFDTGKFYNDVIVISDFAKSDIRFFIKILFGFQDDTVGSTEYLKAVENTLNWDNGTVKDYLYNDNRVLIRTHVILNFIAFKSYLTHALFNCFLSFTGIFFLYKTFKEWFAGKEMAMLLVLCFFPSLWFYTGALLKEGITLLVLGCSLFALKRVLTEAPAFKNILFLLLWSILCFLLKPYLLLYSLICFSLFFLVQKSGKIRYKTVFFFLMMGAFTFLANLVSSGFKHRSLLTATLEQHRRFAGVSKGGIFLAGNGKYIRLKNDSSLILPVKDKKGTYRIRKKAAFMYWKGSNRADTFYCKTNLDTVTEYQLVYIIPESQSNIEINVQSPIQSIMGSLYYTLFHPNFFKAKNLVQRLASFENLLILFALIVTLSGFITSPKNKFLPFVFLFFAFSLCVLIGITAPNSGAIFRYRSPALVFLLLSALYYSETIKKLTLKKFY